MITQVMVDLETMSTNSNAAIVSIGAVKFDPYGKIGELDENQFFCTIDLTSCIDAGMHVSGQTIKWWLEQEKEAQKSLNNDPHWPIEKALGEFWVWFGGVSLPTWGNGADFDCVVLHNAYERLHGSSPCKYHDRRCFRTMKALFPNVEYARPVLAHHALSDATAQAVHLQKLFNFINQKG
jgi:exodeoxyribonuclease VIII